MQTGKEIHMNENEPFQLASCFKIPVLATLFKEVHAGNVDLDTRIQLRPEHRRTGSGVLEALEPGVEITIRDVVSLMINMSDNEATDILMDLLDTEHIDAYMQELGLKISVKRNVKNVIIHHLGRNTDDVSDEEFIQLISEPQMSSGLRNNDIDQLKVFLPNYNNNTSSTLELARLLEMIAKKQIISKEACDEMIQILATQKLRNRIPYLLPPETKVASKTGNVGSVVNDAGIVYLPDNQGEFVIVVLSRGNENDYQGHSTIAKLARVAFDYF